MIFPFEKHQYSDAVSFRNPRCTGFTGSTAARHQAAWAQSQTSPNRHRQSQLQNLEAYPTIGRRRVCRNGASRETVD